MQITLDLCVYCEQKPEEIVAAGYAETIDEALLWVKVGQNRIQLCPDCRQKSAPEADEDYEKLLEGPIDFTPGVTAIEHCCPELEFQGKSEEEATTIIQMEREGGYYWAKCPHCGVVVRSIAEDEEI